MRAWHIVIKEGKLTSTGSKTDNSLTNFKMKQEMMQ